MNARVCEACQAPLPAGTLTCGNCGALTPTEISNDSLGSVRGSPPSGDDRTEQLQRAVGDLYEVRGLIGRGGFAEVYEAYEPRLKRMVAIKVLGADLSLVPAMLDRFRREAEAVARLRHPHIVPIYNVADATGIAWYVMPLVEGESLRAWLERERPLATADAWRILREMTAALAVAHRAGFVHRDVKPENIMLDGPERRTLVMDFGIAKAIGAAAGNENLTGTGIAVGTPRYMSPEQASGESVDARSDVYSVGVVGYEMLAGRLPFEGNTFREVVVKQATEKPPSLAELAPTAPESLVAAIERALDKDPAKRFADAGELAAALQPPAATGPSLSSPSLNVAERVPVWLRWTLAAAGVVGLVIAAFLQNRAFPWKHVQGIDRAKAAQVAGEFLYANGARGSYDEHVGLWVNDTVIGMLNAAYGRTAGATWAAKNFSPYEWRIKRHYGDSSTWAVAVDIAGRVRSARQWQPEPDAKRVSPDTGLRAAKAWLAQLGWSDEQLVRTDSASGPDVHHRFRWRVPGDSVLWRGDPNPAYQEVSVWTHGPQVIRFEHRFATPEAFKTSAGELDDRTGWVVLLLFLPTLLVIVSGIRLRRAPGEDRGRQQLARKLCYVGAVIVAIGSVAGFNSSRVGSAWTSNQPDSWYLVFLTIAMLAIVALLAALMVFTVDQIARQHYPGLVAGYLEVGAGRLTGRPMAVAWLPAYGIGGIVVAGEALASLPLVNRMTRPNIAFTLPDAFHYAVPVSGLVSLVEAFALPAVMLMIMLAITRLTRREAAPVLAVLLFTIADVVATDGNRWIVFLMSLVTYAAGAIIVLRFGLLASAWGVYIALVTGAGLTLLSASRAGFQVAGIVTLAFVALPAVLGVIAQRKQPVGATTGVRTASPATSP